MDQDQDLQNSIHHTERGIVDQETSAAKKSRASYPISRIAVSTALVIACACFFTYKLTVIDPVRQEIAEDLRDGTVDLVMEADASIYQYYAVESDLPDQLPDTLMQTFVSYEKLNETSYSLTPNNSIYSTPIIVDVDQGISVGQILAAINP